MKTGLLFSSQGWTASLQRAAAWTVNYFFKFKLIECARACQLTIATTKHHGSGLMPILPCTVYNGLLFCCLMEKNTQIFSNHLESSDNFPQRHGVVMAHSVAEWLFCWLERENETPTKEHQWVSANGSVMSVFFGCAVLARHSGRCRGARGRPDVAADTNIHYEVRLYQAKVALFPFCH